MASGGTANQELLEGHVSPDNGEEVWEQEYQARAFARATSQLRKEFREPTWRAFWETAVNGKSGEKVAKELDMSLGAVYVAKCRVLARLKETIEKFELTEERCGMLNEDAP